MEYILKKENEIEYYVIPKLKKVQELQLELLKIVDTVAKDNKIPYWLDGGTLLGAVRHKGIIPWDDDIDICLLKTDYDRLIPLLHDYIKDNDEYGLMFYENNMLHWAEYFVNHKYVMVEKGIKKPLRIDILPVKLVKNNIKDKETDKFTVDVGNHFVFGKTKYFPEIKEKYKYGSFKEAMKLKNEFLKFFVNDYLNNNFESKDKENLLINYPYNDVNITREREYYKFSDIFPLSTIKFEGIDFPIPRNHDSYLKVLYGNYNDLPPLDKRKPYSSKYIAREEPDTSINTKYVKYYYERFYFANKKYYKVIALIRQTRSEGLLSAYKSIVKPFIRRGFKFK